ITKAADDAVGAAVNLDLLHAGAVARAVLEVTAFGDDAVERRASAAEPSLRIAQSRCCRRQPNARLVLEIPGSEGLEPADVVRTAATASVRSHPHRPADQRR